ncbi:MAG: endonuclease/exonuclease/phosphatase family protein [Nitrosopumilus sp.]|nr:endonuclease/exonuclease/phosphatase family protein [Nitrosopumilus sp.]NRA05193.1 endonuclease/exonuclease/phosphatase family protein [Nitrosopumilus sp.]
MSKTELKLLQKRITQAKIPKRKRNNFRLLTWNIRNFHGRKESKAISYIAKIIKNFDVIAIQEVKDELGGIEKLQRVLGKKYRFLFSDPSGNGERLVFCYDSKKIQFTGLAAEIVMAPGQGKKTVPAELEFARTPYMASFRTNGCNFILVTVHIYYGSGSAVRYRGAEIKNIAKFLEKRSGDVDSLDSDYIACGDFNIERVRAKIRKRKKVDPLDGLFELLQSKGLIIPDEIKNSPSNLSQTRHFDQIAYHQYDDSTISFVDGGIIDFVGTVYRGDKKLRYKLTDHLPMWAVFETTPDENPKFINP